MNTPLVISSPSLMISRRLTLATMTFWCRTTFLHYLPTYLHVDETIGILARKAFHDDWFNKEYNFNITEADLIELLEVSTKNQLFQFQWVLYEQVDGVAMGSPLGPLMADAFMCNIEEQLTNQNKMPNFYKRYVDDTLSKMPDAEAASTFLATLNEIHPSISFTMELEKNGKLPFLGMEIIRNSTRLDRKVYRKPTDTGLLLHYHSHVHMKYKHSLLKTMLNRAFKLSSNWQFFHQECERLGVIFTQGPPDLHAIALSRAPHTKHHQGFR